jgi:hypothetical protein
VSDADDDDDDDEEDGKPMANGVGNSWYPNVITHYLKSNCSLDGGEYSDAEDDVDVDDDDDDEEDGKPMANGVGNSWHQNVICHYFKSNCSLDGGEDSRAFRTSESESADFSEVRVRKFRTLKTLRTRTQRVCLFTH